MNHRVREKIDCILPLKSPAIALLFGVVLGPIGLLYSTVPGGIIMISLGVIVVSAKLIVPIILTWLLSCVLSAAAVNRYNQAIIQQRLRYFSQANHEQKNNQTRL